MPILNNNQKYGIISIIFHWGMAIIILITFLLGKNLQDNFENYYFILQLHNSFGLLIFILAIFRLIWKFLNIKPDAPSNKIIFMKLASLTHIIFYIFFFYYSYNRIPFDKSSRRCGQLFWYTLTKYFRKKFRVKVLCS